MKRIIGFILIAAMAFMPGATAVEAASVQPERVYFVMLDRFENGDRSNDFGGEASAQAGGFDPTNTGFWHGGDFKGLEQRLGYIKSMGFTAVWISPIVRNQILSVDGRSAGYHGYWGLGFDQTDPHFGTKAEFISLVNMAHGLGLKIILDIVVNHTGDVIDLEGSSLYVGTSVIPYKRCNGSDFDAIKLAGQSSFPTLDELCAKVSFPKIPVVDPRNASIKSPAWLNDVRLYHNRGNSTFDGESSQMGDFYGLDDLFTENPIVIEGLTRLWSNWISETGIDGLRIDTAKHVNEKFWQSFIPAVQKVASDNGKKNFPIWGEVFDASPLETAYWSVEGGLRGILDFAFQDRATNFVGQGSAEALADLFNYDDYYVDGVANPNTFGTFLGNHDMGRVASLLNLSRTSPESAVRKLNLAYAALFLLRGSPIVYYGDEFGLFGGGDKAARQDLFATGVTYWQNELRVGGRPIGAASSFDTTNPLQQTLTLFNGLRQSNVALGAGWQEVLYASDGLLAVTRSDPSSSQQLLVVLNASDSKRSFKVPANVKVLKSLSGQGALNSGQLVMPTQGWGLFEISIRSTSAKPSISLSVSNSGSEIKGRLTLKAKVPGNSPAKVEFFAKVNGAWKSLGADTGRSWSTSAGESGWFRVFPLRSQFKAGSKVDFKAEVTTFDGKTTASSMKSLTITK